MGSEGQASSTAQQPFAQPQPAPVSTTSSTTSPPTKASLKKWWNNFRPPQKNPEVNGRKTSSFQLFDDGQEASDAVSIVFLLYHPLFVEGVMNEHSPVVASRPKLPSSPLTSLVRRVSTHLTRSRVSPKTPRPRPVVVPASTWKPPLRSTYTQLENRNSVFGAGSALGPKSTEELSVPFHRPSPSHKIQRSISRVSDPFKKLRSYAKIAVRKAGPDLPRGIFGVPLRQSITYANVAISLIDNEGKSYIYGYIPIVVAKCGVFLKEKATTTRGIFRLSGSERRIKDLKNIFDSPDRYGKGLDWAGYTVHDAANVLRRYLNQLPEPIVPLDLYERFRDPLRGYVETQRDDESGPVYKPEFDLNQAIVTYQQLITELPPLNLQLLLYILDLLAVFSSKSEENLMNSVNLSAIFQPCLLNHPEHSMAVAEYRLSQDVLVFLIENQDHFLIGMRGTAADEKTVQDVQNGNTPPPGTPTTPSRSKSTMVRSSSNASAGAESVRKFGGVRRNVSTSSRHSRQSNGAPSPASPSHGAPLINTSSGGVHRSNTVPSKRSPSIPSSRMKNSGSPSPTAGGFSNRPGVHRGLSPASPAPTDYSVSPSSPLAASAVGSSLAPGKSGHKQLPLNTADERDGTSPSRERNVSSFFSRSPTTETDKKAPNKLRKKRIPSSSNPSAQSSTHSLSGPRSFSTSPGLHPTAVAEHPQMEGIPSNPTLANTEATPPLSDTHRAEQQGHFPRPDDAQNPQHALKPLTSPTSSLHSHSSVNDQSDLDRIDDPVMNAERAEKRSRWRLTRKKDDPHSLASTLSPKKVGSDNGAGASSSSVGSPARPRKSLQADFESTPIPSQQQSANESGAEEKKGGPLGWIKKMREKREEKEAEKERTKSPPPSSRRGKSPDVEREENIAEPTLEQHMLQDPPQ